MSFQNRVTAGQLLSERLMHLAKSHPVVLTLPRGGVPVGAEIAKALAADLDILLIKRVVSPLHPEVAIGAISEDGVVLWQKEMLEHLALTPADADSLADSKKKEILKQAKLWRPNRNPIDVKNRTVILVDDGLATGSSMMVAVETLKKRKPARIIVAVPVAPSSSAAQISHEVDELVVLLKPDMFYAVGQWYEDFSEVTDEEVTELLQGKSTPQLLEEQVLIPDGEDRVTGIMTTVPNAKALILFAHGSASTHKSTRNQRVARDLNQAGFSTLLFDLLTEWEAEDRQNVFDINLLARRLSVATEWSRSRLGALCPPIAYFGASTGGAAAISAAAGDESIISVVSRGGRPDLAAEKLDRIKAPVLLIVGGADHPIIPLNVDAAKRMKNAEMVMVPGAGHLFEEPGALEKVSEYAIGWFQECLSVALGGKGPFAHERIAEDLLHVAKPYRSGKDLDAWYRKISDARVVMLGEASHGTHEFYETRREITERLIRDYGFRFVAVEGDWPDCYRLTQYTTQAKGKSARDVLSTFRRWPEWMWNNEPTALLLESLKETKTPFYGLDLYSMYDSIEWVRNYASQMSPKLSSQIQGIFSCFEPHKKSETDYARSLMTNSEGCEVEIVAFLTEILRTRTAETNLRDEELFDVQRNAITIRNAERYYRAMVFGGPDSWNVRDHHMMDTLDSVLRHHGETAKAIVWAHNTHIGDYHATDMLKEGYINLGGLARERYGVENVHLVGFGTYEGEVLAGHSWGAVPEKMSIPPAMDGSYEKYLHEASRSLGSPSLILPGISTDPLPSLTTSRGHRAIGVVYQPKEGPHHRNYVPTELCRRYDSFIFIDKTTALKGLTYPEQRKGALPETWPTGL